MSRSLEWDDGVIVAVDQRALPREHRWLRITALEELTEAVAALAIRGAPALGVAGALGVAQSALRNRTPDGVDESAVRAEAERIAAVRPTAANLRGGVKRQGAATERRARPHLEPGARRWRGRHSLLPGRGPGHARVVRARTAHVRVLIRLGGSPAGVIRELPGRQPSPVPVRVLRQRNAGPKKSPASYAAIAEAVGAAGEDLLFLSDVTAELEAADAAGWHTALVRRDDTLDRYGWHTEISSFENVSLSGLAPTQPEGRT